MGAEPARVGEEMAERDPAGAIQRAYGLVGAELERKLVAKGQPALLAAKFRPRELAVLAKNQGLISAADLRAIESLDVLRNLATHSDGDRVTTKEATEFVDLVDGELHVLAVSEPL